ncbi:hypothetical protein M0R45_034817 [Rubus argutus]|uniref:Uncharacterized protein n=1 Tax=Rubus argutus TaxID=59490 RepID=A0AAW1VSZ0_RUBAR
MAGHGGGTVKVRAWALDTPSGISEVRRRSLSKRRGGNGRSKDGETGLGFVDLRWLQVDYDEVRWFMAVKSELGTGSVSLCLIELVDKGSRWHGFVVWGDCRCFKKRRNEMRKVKMNDGVGSQGDKLIAD